MQTTFTTNDIGQQFMLEGVDGITYTLVWFDEVPHYSDGKPVLWAKVVRTGEQNGHSYLVRQDSLRRVPCVMCGKRPVQIVVNAAGGGYCSPECEASYVEGE